MADGSLVRVHPNRLPPPAIAAGRYTEIASTSGRICMATGEGKIACWGDDWPGGLAAVRPLTNGLSDPPAPPTAPPRPPAPPAPN